MHIKSPIFLSAFLILIGTSAQAQNKLTVFAAASLTNALTEIATAYEKESSVQVQTSFASSSALAKQIENGAPADIFLSADAKWVNYLQDKSLIQSTTRVNLLGNRLVLIAPKGKGFKTQMYKGFNFANAFYGRLCTGETESVPVGIYAKQSLKYFNWWDGVKSRIVGTQDVRAALTFVERGECDAGIVYETDAKVSEKIEPIANFPENSHEPIIYPLALIKNANPEANGFYLFLKSEKAKEIFNKYGFSTFAN